MAAIGTSGLSLALGLYNTQQISSLQERLSSGDAGVVSSVLTPQTVVKAPDVVAPAETIATTAFKPASSSEVRELQERIAQLETFSSSVSSSSTVNSSNMSQSVGDLSTKLSELELFANTASTQSSTNMRNIVMTNDEVDRLTTYTSEQITALRERVASSENKVSANDSNIGNLQTGVDGVEAGVVAANARIDAVLSMSSSLESSLGATTTSVAQSTDNISRMSKDLTSLTLGVDALGDAITLVDENESDTRDNLAALTASWNALKSKAYVSGDVLNAVSLRATASSMSLLMNDGQKCALHLGPITDPNWTLHASSPAGKGPDGKTPLAFGDVTSTAARLRLNGDPKCGFIMENDKGQGVFSVSTDGSTRIAHGKIGDLEEGVPAFAHHKQFTSSGYALRQSSNGVTHVNSPSTLFLSAGGKWKAHFTGTGGMTVATAGGGRSSYFGKDGSVSNEMRGNGETHFYVGNTQVARARANGFYAGAYHVSSSLSDLYKRVKAIEGSYVNKDKTVRLRNHIVQRKDRHKGYVGAHNWDIVCDKKSGDNATNFSIMQ